MHACTYNIDIVYKKHCKSYYYCVDIAVSAGYSMCCHTIQCVCNYNLYAQYTATMFDVHDIKCASQSCHLLYHFLYPVGLTPSLFTICTYIILVFRRAQSHKFVIK